MLWFGALSDFFTNFKDVRSFIPIAWFVALKKNIPWVPGPPSRLHGAAWADWWGMAGVVDARIAACAPARNNSCQPLPRPMGTSMGPWGPRGGSEIPLGAKWAEEQSKSCNFVFQCSFSCFYVSLYTPPLMTRLFPVSSPMS